MSEQDFDYDQLNLHVKNRLVALRRAVPGEIVDELHHWIYRLVAAAYSAGHVDGVAEYQLRAGKLED